MTSTTDKKRPRGRPRQEWIDIVKSDIEKFALGLRLDIEKDDVK